MTIIDIMPLRIDHGKGGQRAADSIATALRCEKDGRTAQTERTMRSDAKVMIKRRGRTNMMESEAGTCLLGPYSDK